MKRFNSLKRHKEFNYVYRAGKSCSCKIATMIFTRSRLQQTRAGFSVSKKVGNAVVRNRTKRRMREAFTIVLPQIKSGYNLIFVVRPAAYNEPFDSIVRSLKYMLKKANLICSEDNQLCSTKP